MLKGIYAYFNVSLDVARMTVSSIIIKTRSHFRKPPSLRRCLIILISISTNSTKRKHVGEACHTPTVDVIIAELRVLSLTLYIDIRALSIMLAQPTLFKFLNIFPFIHNYKLSREVNEWNIHLNFICDTVVKVSACVNCSHSGDGLGLFSKGFIPECKSVFWNKIR